MKWTLELVKECAKAHGYEAIQIDGIPEGFSWKRPDIFISEKHHKGEFVAFIPLSETGEKESHMSAKTIEELAELFKQKNATK